MTVRTSDVTTMIERDVLSMVIGWLIMLSISLLSE